MKLLEQSETILNISIIIEMHVTTSGFIEFYPPSLFKINPLMHERGGGTVRQPPSVAFCPLLKKSKGNPQLKILDFSNFLLRMPIWGKETQATFDYL